MAWQDVLLSLWNNFIIGLPSLVYAIIWLIVGFIIGKVIGRIVKEILIKVDLDKFIVEKEKLKIKFSDIFATISRWVIYLIFIIIAAEALNIAVVTNLVTSAIGFLIGVVEATVIIIVGYGLALYIKDRVVGTKTVYGDLVGKILFFLILYVSIALALPFVGIDVTLINWILIVIVASLGLGFAIAIGLGMKDVMKDLAKDYARKFKRRRR
jgi:hypothetical protein